MPDSASLTAVARLAGRNSPLVEFLHFGWKEAQACLLAGLFFASVLFIPRSDAFGTPR